MKRAWLLWRARRALRRARRIVERAERAVETGRKDEAERLLIEANTIIAHD